MTLWWGTDRPTQSLISLGFFCSIPANIDHSRRNVSACTEYLSASSDNWQGLNTLHSLQLSQLLPVYIHHLCLSLFDICMISNDSIWNQIVIGVRLWDPVVLFYNSQPLVTMTRPVSRVGGGQCLLINQNINMTGINRPDMPLWQWTINIYWISQILIDKVYWSMIIFLTWLVILRYILLFNILSVTSHMFLCRSLHLQLSYK